MIRALSCALLGLFTGCAAAPARAPLEDEQAAYAPLASQDGQGQAGQAGQAGQDGQDGQDGQEDTSGFAARLPDFTRDDPHGVPHAAKTLGKHGLVLVVSAPTLSNADAQSNWVDALLAARPDETPICLALLQDMGPSWFKGTALQRMRDEDDPKQPPVLLIDLKGELREKLGVDEDATVVLVYSARRVLVDWETGAASAERARRLWQAVQAQD